MVEVTFGETNAGLKYHMVQSVVGEEGLASIQAGVRALLWRRF